MNNTTLPHQWRRVALGDVLEERLDRAWPEAELLSVTGDRGVILQSESSKRDTSSADKSKYKHVYPNDIVYNTMRMWQGVSARSPYEGIVSPAYTVCRPTSDVDPRYMAALLKHPDLVVQFHRFAQGLVDDTLNLKYQAFAKISAILPPLPEQRRIADILDTVDAAIQQTEALIAKLKLMKAGLLHDLLTRGLDEQGQLRDPIGRPEQFKDSPLGRIPKEWEVRSLGTMARIRRGASPRPIDSPVWFSDNGPGWVRIADVTRSKDHLRETEQHLSPLGVSKSVPVHPGQVIMSIAATIGEPIILDIEACIHDGFVVLDEYERFLTANFLVHYLRFRQGYFRNQGQTGTQANLNTGIVKSNLLGVPPLIEQQSIAAILDNHDVNIRAEEAYCDKLKQLKQGLMRDLLTGRVRVQAEEEAL